MIDPNVPFAVRMGLHTGEAIEHDRNYVGGEVNRTARLMALGARWAGARVGHDRGAAAQPGVAASRSASTACAACEDGWPCSRSSPTGCRADFPVLRSVDYFAGNLPRQFSSLVGREQLVAEVAELVRADRLVTLTRRRRGRARPGCRSRSAPSWRASSRTACGSSSWPPSADGSVPGGDRHGAGHHAAGRRAAASTRSPRPWPASACCCVVDNCEHVLDRRRRAVETILGRAGSVKVVATSRETLGLDRGDERHRQPARGGRWRSPPTPSPCSSIEPVPSDPTSGSQEPTDAAAVTEICEAVDGLPLGIELAAARMAAMSAVEVRDRLADRFRLLRGTTPGPERQLTLRHAVEWSYDLLQRRASGRCCGRSRCSPAGSISPAPAPSPASTDEVDVLQHARFPRPQVARGRRPHRLAHALRHVRDDPPVRRGPVGGRRRRGGHPRSACGVLRTSGGSPLGALERARAGVTPSTGSRSSWATSARRSDGAAGPRQRRGGDRHRRPRGADGVLGPAVRDPVMGRGADRGRHGRRRAASPSPLHGVPATPASPAGPSRWSSARPPRHRARGRSAATTRANRATSMFIEALGAGVLRRPRPLRRAHRRVACGATARRGATASPSYVDGLQSAGRVDEALALTEAVGRCRTRPRQPVLDLLRALDRRHGVLPGRRPTGPGGVGRGRGLRARAPRPVLRRLPRARRGTPAHVRR